MYQILVIIALVALILVSRHVKKQPKEIRRKLAIKYGLYGAAIVLIGLVATGKMHWVAGAIGAALPVLQRLFSLGLRILPFIKTRQNQEHGGSHQQTAAQAGSMKKEEALKILGFQNVPSKEDIVQRHRELIQKNHPDRGGSDYLAAQINEAKDVLLQHVKHS